MQNIVATLILSLVAACNYQSLSKNNLPAPDIDVDVLSVSRGLIEARVQIKNTTNQPVCMGAFPENDAWMPILEIYFRRIWDEQNIEWAHEFESSIVTQKDAFYIQNFSDPVLKLLPNGEAAYTLSFRWRNAEPQVQPDVPLGGEASNVPFNSKQRLWIDVGIRLEDCSDLRLPALGAAHGRSDAFLFPG